MSQIIDNPGAGTPTLAITDNRGLTVRTLQYNRQTITDAPQALITRVLADDSGLSTAQWDPRLYMNWLNDPNVSANQANQVSLTGQRLRRDSVDSGWNVTLYDAEGRPVWQQDVSAVCRRQEFDLIGRLTASYTQQNGGSERVAARFFYGDTDAQTATPQDDNLRGRMVRHYHDAGKTTISGYTLGGGMVCSTTQLLASPEQQSDWRGDDEMTWQSALSPENWTTTWMYNASGTTLTQTDACQNQQRFFYDVAGVLCASELTQSGGQPTPLLKSLTWTAAGRKLVEVAGNGVQTTWGYDEKDQRLISIRAVRGDGSLLQYLTYGRDPVGNVVSISDGTAAISYFRNQAASGDACYRYDALYQMIGATGRENADISPQTAALPDVVKDTSNLVSYSRSYQYDSAGNLQQMAHSGASSYTYTMAISQSNNRSVLNSDGSVTPEQVDSYFDVHGNLLQMQAGTPLIWNELNQLRYVVTVDRGGALEGNDREVYQYCQGSRIRKQSRTLTNSDSHIWQVDDVIYLPGLEVRRSYVDNNGSPQPVTEELHSLKINDGSRAVIRVLHWVTGQPTDIEADQIRYSLDNHIGSVNIELDGSGNILSREEYYPFGGTAVLVGNSSEVKYKYVRYSGKERDSAGLYYYGHRYFAPWLFRWISPDPTGTSDMINVYCFVGNNPVTWRDASGFVDTADLSPELIGMLKGEDEIYGAALGVIQQGNNAATSIINGTETPSTADRRINPFSSTIENIAAGTHQRLIQESNDTKALSSLDMQDIGIINLYSVESGPFHTMMLPGAELTKSQSSEGYTSEMALSLHEALEKMPPRPGQSYRGAMLGEKTMYSAGNESTGASHSGYYPRRENMIMPGDYVTTQTFFSTTADKGVASEFVMRQRFGDAFSFESVVFNINGLNGRNVAELTLQDQAEILMQPGALFKVMDVRRGDLGLQISLNEVSEKDWENEEIIHGERGIRDYRYGTRINAKPQYPTA
ncbi:RHS repeat-associated core domain-containing protein [Klebsiella oxytoca]|uniref:RHS repeat-associated core domain-containing protein n=1 Tax=Klebsiella oxytoca TaxID=571 RepID=UPI0007DAD2BF|nr:RHS repeat-associated core domain-containing protein [Klebsiella oxytoca]